MTLTLGVLLIAALAVGSIAYTTYVAEIIVGTAAMRWLLRRVRPA